MDLRYLSIVVVSLILCFYEVHGTIETIIKQSSGTVHSPNFPNPYPRDSDEDYVWRIEVPKGYLIKVTFTSIKLTWKDEVQVFDGSICRSWAWNHKLRTYKGVHNNNPVDVIFNTKNEMCVELERYKGSAEKTGFSFDFVAIPACKGTLTAPVGDIVSQGYPIYDYNSNQKCKWIIQAPEGQTIVIDFQEFVLEGSSECDNDYLTVSEDGKEILRACGTPKLSQLRSTTNSLKVKFVTFRIYTYKGFWLTYKVSGCKKAKLPSLQNGQLMNPSSTSYVTSYIAKYQCNSGYRLKAGIQETTSRCGENNMWSPITDTCERIYCGDPGYPGNGNVDFTPVAAGSSKYSIGTLATYDCKPNYNMLGEPTIACLDTGVWNGTRPKCNVTGTVLCDDLGDPLNGVKVGTNYTTGQTLQFKCNTGYTLQGSSTRVCQANGIWSGTDVTCTVVTCPSKLNSPQDGAVTFNDNSYGNVAVYSCNQGYRLLGNVTRKCSQDGQWNGNDPVCKRIMCSKPTVLDHSKVQVTGLDYGSVATYTCDDGYILEGTTSRTCSDGGQWTRSAPFCAQNITGNGMTTTASIEITTPDTPSTSKPTTKLEITTPPTDKPTTKLEITSPPTDKPTTKLEITTPPTDKPTTKLVTPTSTPRSTSSAPRPTSSPTATTSAVPVVKSSPTMSTKVTSAENARNPDELNADDDNGNNMGMFIGIGVGAAVFILLGLLCGFLLFRRKRSNGGHQERDENNIDKNFDNPMYAEMNSGTSGVSVDEQTGSVAYRVPHTSADSGDLYAESVKRPEVNRGFDDVTYDNADNVGSDWDSGPRPLMLENDLYESKS